MTRTGRWLILALFCAAFCPHRTTANTFTATSCSASDVQAAISLTSNGDTVLIPGGSCTWSTPVTITNAITLNGQGTTTITWNTSSQAGHLNVMAIASGNTFVTGITFNGEYSNGACPITLTTSISPLSATFRFYGNTLNWIGGSYQGTMLCVTGTGPGLIDHNTFTTDHGADEIIHVLGQGADDASGWATDVVPGSSNMIFIEANTFDYEANTSPANSGPPYYFWGTSAVQVYYGARVAFRDNNVTMMQVDVHGTCGSINGRWFEIYNNTFSEVPNANQSNYMALRGGTGVVWGNTVSDPSDNQTTGVIQLTEDCTSGSYPLAGQIGRGINQTGSPTYIWNNPSTMEINDTNTTYVQLNRDYFTSPSQPSTIERCQSAADVSAGCPVSYNYTPYVYPHPLDTNSDPPAAPTNLKASIN